MSEFTLVLGNQLFAPKFFRGFPKQVFMAEDLGLCTHFKYHKHKLIHFLASMRTHAAELESKGFKVDYHYFEKKKTFIQRLKKYIKDHKRETVHVFEIEDKFFERELKDFFLDHNIEMVIKPTPMFLCSREEFSAFARKYKRPLLNNFYIEQRKKRDVLMTGDKPKGGKWHFDHDNRKKIPKKFEVTSHLPKAISGGIVDEVKKLIDKEFPDHPGSSSNYWIPVDRKSAKKNFSSYLKTRFSHFGEFQDAIDPRNPFLYHSLISPSINIGHLTPDEVVKEAEKLATKDNLNSVEGFIRQVMGWREFIRGIYQKFDDLQQEENFFEHKKKLKQSWYEGTTEIPPLDDAIKKANEWGYCHHIERLMVIGNLMLLLEVHPQEVYKWFMEMFVDSSDWVMGPNVFGMSQFSDGGIFATKPYMSGSNYILKMSHYKKDPSWCDEWDGLYWRFIDRKREFLKGNHRLNMMVKMLDKMDPERKKHLFACAERAQKRLTK